MGYEAKNKNLFYETKDNLLEEVEKSPFTLEYHTFDLHNSEMNDKNIETAHPCRVFRF